MGKTIVQKWKKATSSWRALLKIVVIWERLCVNRVRSLLSMRCLLLRYSFESRPNSSTLGARLSDDHCSIDKRLLGLGKIKYDWRKEDWLVQKFGLRQLESLNAIQAEPPFLFITQEYNLVPRVLSYSAPVARERTLGTRLSRRQKDALLSGMTI